jgi:hypothetical protein
MFTIDSKKRISCFFALFFFSIPAIAASGNMYIGTSLGAGMMTVAHRSPVITYDEVIMDAYPLNKNHASAPIMSLNAGYEFSGVKWKPAIAFGLGVYGNLANESYHGQLIETVEGDESSTLYNYSYDINSTRVMAELQLTWMLGQVSPFINVGVGPAWNKMNGYMEMAVDSTGYPALPPFQSQTHVNIAYQAGFGVSTAFNFAGSQSPVSQERISVGYRYVNLGSTSFGTRGADYPYSLDTGLLKTNEVYLGYTHLF